MLQRTIASRSAQSAVITRQLSRMLSHMRPFILSGGNNAVRGDACMLHTWPNEGNMPISSCRLLHVCAWPVTVTYCLNRHALPIQSSSSHLRWRLSNQLNAFSLLCCTRATPSAAAGALRRTGTYSSQKLPPYAVDVKDSGDSAVYEELAATSSID